ncbi:MAG TPA: GNAT family N-acetyltransferase [Gemmatimonadaceae bacterium]|nr:GNAT family N-acetyltransferase [Gemmatimonadaceae bacterium]
MSHLSLPDVRGPFPITDDDIAPLNVVFSDAFTDRYRRDGMVGVRVPTLNHAIWKFSLADAGLGAMLWRDADGGVAAFNVAHLSGTEGWMGPIAVRPDLQGRGVGKTVVRAGIDWLRGRGAAVIGLETMPRTVDNIGFYSTLGFVAGPLTITFTLTSANGESVDRLGKYGPREQDALTAEMQLLTARSSYVHDFTREIRLTAELAIGDTVLLRARDELVGFALCHTAPLVEGRVREELRVLKVVLADPMYVSAMARAIAAFARESSTQRAALRVQAGNDRVYRAIVGAGGRVRWTDLRMTLDGYPEHPTRCGIVLSNWEI